ncbi:symmetrical bis(5'-nucleosyl)-tetraphosphatase [Candidatus Vallotia cooleyia]|uniref:symmetrical bis(5'-nucleosyl)-tetraphosphatase n=1 Tax=Candidatus Vallotiella adelgis TaxID=1177211 RepID=UPI001D020381|nr:symmetrical bis(5'-nucleosyl)-tetraphosphatase [Candidatus Vallotia cooleyia]UDG82446.1 Bis(5'-nucleosyl)-tetraphosphatase, symmetrical [Candidatus Vallotia cooleyia]
MISRTPAPEPNALARLSPDTNVSTPIGIGDIQGCCNALNRLLEKLGSTVNTALWFAGDLVNRGPASLAVLRRIIELGERAVTVLGNHDFHLLAIAAGAHYPKHGDTLNDILAAPDAADLIYWLRHRPLMHYDGKRLLVHAGILPQWNISIALKLAHEIEVQLRGNDWKEFLQSIWGNDPDTWHNTLKGKSRSRVIVNAMTRMRFCDTRGRMEFSESGPPSTAPTGFMPWFDVPNRLSSDTLVVFGHWAALGLVMHKNMIALDSGCVWGKKLSAVQLDTDPRRRTVVQVDCSKQR